MNAPHHSFHTQAIKSLQPIREAIQKAVQQYEATHPIEQVAPFCRLPAHKGAKRHGRS